MILRNRGLLGLLAIVAAIAAASCGSNPVTSPTTVPAPDSGASVPGQPPASPPAYARVSGLVAAGSSSSAEAAFTGAIESISAPSLMVSGRSVVTDVNTKITRHGALITVADLAVGQTVEVSGITQSGSVLASKIKVEDDGQEADFGGTISAITPPSLIVDARTVVTDASTRIERDGKAITLADLHVGDTVKVEGAVQSGGAVLASEIKVTGGDDGGDDHSGDDHGGDDHGGGDHGGGDHGGGDHGGGDHGGDD